MADVPTPIRDALARLMDRLRLDGVDPATVIRWDVMTNSSTLSFRLAADDGRWVFSDGLPTAPRLSIALGVDEVLGLAAGSLGAGPAFLSGRLRLSGDLVLAQTLLPGFDQPLTAPRPDQTGP